MAIMKGAEPFLLMGSRRGVLLVHGFTGSPSEMRLLGDHLHTLGFTVFAPRLCGHGTTVEDMAGTGWLHWYSAVEDGYSILRQLCDEVHVVGLSMGGLLSLKLGAEYKVSKLVSICTPIYIADKRLSLLPVYRLFRSYMPKRRKRFAGVDPVYSIHYDYTPLSSLSSLLKLIRHVDKLLPVVKVPLLIIQSRNDHTVLPRSAKHIFDRVGTKEKQLVFLEKSGHVATLDVERQQVFEEIADFLGR